jgi:hypothetical protein
LKNKLFIIENAIIKKDNVLLGMNKRLNKISENEEAKYVSYVDREILVTEPTVAVNEMYDELVLYKQIYEDLIKHVKENKKSIIKYQNLIYVR